MVVFFELSLPILNTGRLVDSAVEEVVARVVTLEDISADAALALITLLTLLKDFVPSLFKVSKKLFVISGMQFCASETFFSILLSNVLHSTSYHHSFVLNLGKFPENLHHFDTLLLIFP